MRKIILDTNIVIEILRGNKRILGQIDNYDIICLPVTVCGELLFGVYNSTQIKNELSKFEQFVSSTEIIEINFSTVENYAIIRNQLKRKGRPIPENDIWIAAVAMTNDIPLISKDNHFLEVEELPFILVV